MAGQVWRFCSFCYSIFTSPSFLILCVLFLSLAFTLAVVVIVVVDCLLVSFGCLILSFRWLRAFVLSFILSFDFFFSFVFVAFCFSHFCRTDCFAVSCSQLSPIFTRSHQTHHIRSSISTNFHLVFSLLLLLHLIVFT